MSKLSERLIYFRKIAGLTQEQFADDIGWPRTILAKVEAGLRDLKSAEIILFAKRFGVTTDILLGLTDLPASVKIIAVDFDGCIVENKYPDIGEAIPETIRRLLDEQAGGTKIILWTCRVGKRLDAAVGFCKGQGIKFDAVNENLPEVIAEFGGDTRKIYADEYWDDMAVRVPEDR